MKKKLCSIHVTKPFDGVSEQHEKLKILDKKLYLIVTYLGSVYTPKWPSRQIL